MAKSRHNPESQETSSRGTLAMLTIGALLVAGLVVWALTRTVEPSVAAPLSTAETTTAPIAIETAATSTPVPSPAIDTAASSGFNSPLTPAGIAPPTQSPDKAEVGRISAEDLQQKWKAGSVTVVDVRDALSFEAGHIPGALNIPMASVEANLDLLPKGKPIVTYCT
jgi:hypothetical protein